MINLILIAAILIGSEARMYSVREFKSNEDCSGPTLWRAASTDQYDSAGANEFRISITFN